MKQNKIEIPIYRAKKIDSNEYIVGYYSPDKNYQEHIHTIFYFDTGDFNVDRKTITQIDQTTLAIHFPNMLDGQKNKIFASLSEDGKGGDVVTHPDYGDNKYILIYDKDRFEVGIKLIEIDEKGCWEYSPLQEEELELFEAIGIQK